MLSFNLNIKNISNTKIAKFLIIGRSVSIKKYIYHLNNTFCSVNNSSFLFGTDGDSIVSKIPIFVV